MNPTDQSCHNNQSNGESSNVNSAAHPQRIPPPGEASTHLGVAASVSSTASATSSLLTHPQNVSLVGTPPVAPAAAINAAIASANAPAARPVVPANVPAPAAPLPAASVVPTVQPTFSVPVATGVASTIPMAPLAPAPSTTTAPARTVQSIPKVATAGAGWSGSNAFPNSNSSTIAPTPVPNPVANPVPNPLAMLGLGVSRSQVQPAPVVIAPAQPKILQMQPAPVAPAPVAPVSTTNQNRYVVGAGVAPTATATSAPVPVPVQNAGTNRMSGNGTPAPSMAQNNMAVNRTMNVAQNQARILSAPGPGPGQANTNVNVSASASVNPNGNVRLLSQAQVPQQPQVRAQVPVQPAPVQYNNHVYTQQQQQQQQQANQGVRTAAQIVRPVQPTTVPQPVPALTPIQQQYQGVMAPGQHQQQNAARVVQMQSQPQPIPRARAVAPTPAPATVPQAAPAPTQPPQRRKLVLSPEGRDALTKAVLSSLKNPDGAMDQALLQKAMQTTQLSKMAILNAAKMARDRELKKRRANASAAAAANPQSRMRGNVHAPMHPHAPHKAFSNVIGPPARSIISAAPASIPPPQAQAPRVIAAPVPMQRAQHTLMTSRVHPPLTTRVHPPPQAVSRPKPYKQAQRPAYVKPSTPRAKKALSSVSSSSKIIRTSDSKPQPKTPTISKKTQLQLKNEAMAKAAASAAAALSREIKNWRRIQHGMVAIRKNPVTGKTNLRPYSLGAVSRCRKMNPILPKSISANLGKDVRASLTQLQNKLKTAGPGGRPSLSEESKGVSSTEVVIIPKARLVQNANVPLMDVTEKYKRLKLQPRKESRLLEKNLRKHRQVVCDKLVKKHKDLNKALMTHTTEFYKFHRLRKIETSKFAKSVRDFVAAEERKKQKNEVNEEKARLNALKANDMEAYTVLVQETRNDRLKFLLNKTDEYIDQISGLLKDQHGDQTAVSSSAPAGKPDSEEPESDTLAVSSFAEVGNEASNYYDTAHIRQETVQQPSNLLGGNLKEYQVSGLQWLVSLYNNNLNGILADEMGLGKTVQTIALIAYLMETKDNRGPYLVIVPLSTLSNWVNEFRRWCPSATVIVYKGTPAQRKGLYKSEVREGHFNVLLTTYEYIIKDKSSLRKVEWEYAIVDEGHRMKNAQSKFAVILGTQYQTKHRILLTGTPLQNSLPELWALLNFLLPSVFNSVETFDQWFNKPFAQFGTAAVNDGEQEETVNTEERLLIIQRLHELLRPFMLRRIKADVLDQLPDKVEKVLRCELSSWQKELYKQISYSVLQDGQKKSKRGLNNVVMQLRKVCNHPYMFTPEGYYITEDIIRTSGKFELLDRMLPKLKAAGHRILMFFQMTAAMTIMEDYLKYRNLLSLRLDGSTTGEERERRMDLFNSPNSPYFIFMLSTRAGGLGLNLVSADTVIIFDSDWNPMMDLQAQDRAHRIGQKKVVSVFRLMTNSPVEEKILSRATEKLNMSELIVEAGKFDKSKVEESAMEERNKIMEILLTDFDTTVSKGQGTGTTGNIEEEDEEDAENEKEEIDVNELLSRNDEDFEFYTKLDAGEVDNSEVFVSPGLLTDPDDIPDWIRYTSGSKEGDEENNKNENGILDPGVRRKAASAKTYDDGLTEKQFLRIMEKQAQKEEDDAKARKLEWKQNRDKKLSESAPTPAPTDANISPVSKMPEETQARILSMTKSIIAIRDPKSNRRYSDIFRDRVSRDEYPEYYNMIENPIAINDIMKKCRTKVYQSAFQYHADWKLMFANAVKFNGESSWIVADGKVLEVELNRLLTKYRVLEEAEPQPEPVVEASPPKKRKPRIKLSLKKLTRKRKTEDGTPAKGRKKAKTKGS